MVQKRLRRSVINGVFWNDPPCTNLRLDLANDRGVHILGSRTSFGVDLFARKKNNTRLQLLLLRQVLQDGLLPLL